MKNRVIAMTLTAAALFSLCACGVEKPVLESVSGQQKSSEGSAAAETEKKKLTVNDSKIKGDLSKKFHVNANLDDGGKTELPTYNLTSINMTEDRFVKQIMSDYVREDIDSHVTAFINDTEKLVVDPEGLHTNSDSPSPNISYSLDKGKEYEAAIKHFSPYNTLDSDAAKTAVADVKAMLDKLRVKYDDDFLAAKVSYTDLNNFYTSSIELQNPDLPDDVKDQVDTDAPASLLTDQILLYSEGKDARLDKDFKFTKDDSCFVVKGNMCINDVNISSSTYEPYGITAAVSSRGIEYLYADNMYVSDNGSTDSSIITPEQAVEIVYKEYEKSPEKDKYEVYINDIRLTYRKVNETTGNGKADASKATIGPVWSISMDVNNREEGFLTGTEAEVAAGSGELIASFFFGDPENTDRSLSDEGITEE